MSDVFKELQIKFEKMAKRALKRCPREQLEPPRCYRCNDTGIITYQKEIDGHKGWFAAGCNCAAGVGSNLPKYEHLTGTPGNEYIYARNRKMFNYLNDKFKELKRD